MGNAESHPETTAESMAETMTTGEGNATTSTTPNDNKKGGAVGKDSPSVASTSAEDDGSQEKRDSDKHHGRSGSAGRRDRGNRATPPPPRSADDQINVNMPMADLMAYLQVVANNSNQLPLTVRDDPELDRTVSSLTAEEYARKSAAFVPADVRVIGGTFTRYGRVWDLPTSGEYNIVDGAQEPGRSYGGACCNTLLKVIYDAANEMEGAMQNQAAADALFEEDEEEDGSVMQSVAGKSYKSAYSLECGSNIPSCKITWAALFRQMRSEFKDVGYAQAPKITCTRKLDLNQPFSLAPSNFDPSRNKKRSLLIACNYKGNPNGAELKAGHDDIRSMKDYIVNVHGFSERSEDMTVLMDDGVCVPPTRSNIVEAFKHLSETSQPGDAVFVQFSGHGGRVLDAAVDSEAESYDEVIAPIDYETEGVIRDTLIFKTLLAPMRYGVTLTVMIDCCDTGMVLELPYAWSSRHDKHGKGKAKMTCNDDFSFVRFLKVVKTLYESSTFTQLGKTVGSALNPLQTPSYSSKEEESLNGTRNDKAGDQSTSIFDAIADACSAGNKNRSKYDERTIGRKDTLLDQMIKGCSILSGPAHDEEFSDEDTFKTRTEEDEMSYDYTEEGESFETDYSSPRHSRTSSRRSRRRRRR